MLTIFRNSNVYWIRFSVHNDKSSARDQGPVHLRDNRTRVSQFVISIQDEDRINTVYRQMRICRLAMDEANVEFLLEDRSGRRNISGNQRMSSAMTRPVLPTAADNFSVKYPEPHPKSTTVSPARGSRACKTSNGRCHWSRAASTVSNCERVLSAEKPTLRKMRNATAETRRARNFKR